MTPEPLGRGLELSPKLRTNINPTDAIALRTRLRESGETRNPFLFVCWPGRIANKVAHAITMADGHSDRIAKLELPDKHNTWLRSRGKR